MFQRGAARVLGLFLFAFIIERFTEKLPKPLWFASVFVAIFFVDNMRRLSGKSDRPLFLEDVIVGLVLYAGFGYLSSALDTTLSAYTGRHASPAFPAVLMALLDKSWPSEALSSRRR